MTRIPRDDENRIVAAILRAAAETLPGGPELRGQPALEAYQSLARSRGLTLEQVLRAACRTSWALLAALPPVEQRDDDGTTCRVTP